MSDHPAVWRIWGSKYHRGPSRLVRYWIALATCFLHGHRPNLTRSDGSKGCTRCWTRKAVPIGSSEQEDS